jgi:hypothetical protein
VSHQDLETVEEWNGCEWGHDEVDECDECGGCRECGNCYCDEDSDDDYMNDELFSN